MKRLSRISVLLLAIATMAAGPVLADTYTIDVSHSNVGFSIRHLVSKTKGTFASFGGTIAYDAAHPDKSTFNGSIDVASIDTQNERRDGHLQRADFFDVAQYPTITFVSTKVETKSDSLLHVTGDLMIHGVTKAVTIPLKSLDPARIQTMARSRLVWQVKSQSKLPILASTAGKTSTRFLATM